MTRKIIFAEELDADGSTPDCRCVATAVCVDCGFTIDENRIFCEPTLIIRLDSDEDRTAEYTADIYSTDVLSEHTSKRYEFPISKKAFSGNLTVSLREPIEGFEIEPTAVVLDAYSDAVVKNVEESGDKLVLVGELCLNILTNCENEYSLKEIKSPFKYEVEGGDGALFYTDCSAVALIPKAKIESGKLSCDCEVHISGRSYSKDEFSAVNEVIFGERVTRDGAITVCFPSPTDTLWDISKRYHIPTESIVSQDSRLKSGEAIVF